MGTKFIGPAIKLQSERLSYPGLQPREIIIWREWLKLHEREYTRFDYNVRIGKGYDPGPGWPEETRRMAIMNTQLRVDAVGYQGAAPTLFEVKDRGGLSAVGQLVGYEAVWLEDRLSAIAPKLALVTNRIQPNIVPLLNKNSITLYAVPADFSELRVLPFFPGYKRGRSQ